MRDTSITSPAELIAVVPAVLGFHPVDSLTALWTNQSGTLVWSLRFDLATPFTAITSRLLELASRTAPGRLFIVVHAESAPIWMDDLITDLSDLDIPDVLLASSASWRSLLCDSPECCPEEGHRLPEGVTALEADRVLRGEPAIASSREELLTRYELRPTEQPTSTELQAAAAKCEGTIIERTDRVIAALRLLPSTGFGSQCRSATIATVMVLVQDKDVRDLVLAVIIDADDSSLLTDSMITVALCSADDLRPVTAGMAAAVMAATTGSAPGIWALLELAGDDRLAQLVAASQHAMINPKELRTVFRDADRILRERVSA